MGLGVGRGLVNLFKKWGKDIGNAADNVWLRADAQKAIREAVEKKYKPRIDRANKSESKRAESIKDLDDKLTQSKKELQDAKDAWQKNYDSALADAQKQKQIDIDDYKQKLQGYNDAVANAKAGRQSILDPLYDSERDYNPRKTIFTDVNTGENYILDLFTNNFVKLTKSNAPKGMKNYEQRLFDSRTDKVINAFDEKDITKYRSNSTFDRYFNNKQNAALRNADNQIKQAEDDLANWQTNNTQPKAWSKTDSNRFDKDFNSNNSKPTDYSFNGQTYADVAALDADYQKALTHLKDRQNYFRTHASNLASEREAEIARRIQDAKDMNKAKVALGGTLGAGTLYAAARAMYGKHGTDNPDNTDNTNNGEPDSNFNVKNLPEVQAQLNDEQQSDTGFDPDKADALASASALARASYDEGVEDGNSIASSDDLGNRIAASTGGHTIDDKLFELIKAMQDPYKADAVANYIYSRHGDNPELQRLGWRAWLNKYYGDSLRSMMNIDPSGYKGMHISGGL